MTWLLKRLAASTPRLARTRAARRARFSRACAVPLTAVMLWGCSEDGPVDMEPPDPPDAGPVDMPCVPKASNAASPARCTDPGNSDDSLPTCEEWTKVEPPGAVCSDGSQYKFFVNYADDSDNLMIMFEPGGACWDFESCTGAARGAANPHGIPDDHMVQWQYLNLLRRSAENPTRNWNLVFVPYCTGDGHAGDKVATYEDPAGGPALTYRHAGLANTRAVIDHLSERFPDIPQLLVTGCSAGGNGALQNYAFIREGLPGSQCGYLLNDSGPVFSSDGNQRQVHETVREAWNLRSLVDSLSGLLSVDADMLANDFGLLNTAVAEKYPKDRMGLSAYRMDFNYSLYSYERFFPDATPDDIHALYWEDLERLLATYEEYDNLAYYVPFFRTDNCSHCVTIPPIGHDVATILTQPWLGSEIGMRNMRNFVDLLLDDSKALASSLEEPVSGEDFTEEQLAMCLDPTP